MCLGSQRRRTPPFLKGEGGQSLHFDSKYILRTQYGVVAAEIDAQIHASLFYLFVIVLVIFSFSDIKNPKQGLTPQRAMWSECS